MRLRLPIIGQGFGPGGNFSFSFCSWEKKIFDTSARRNSHESVKTADETEASMYVNQLW